MKDKKWAAVLITIAAIAASMTAAACGLGGDGESSAVRLNELQVIGTHNSYHAAAVAHRGHLAFDPFWPARSSSAMRR
jgi:hypothetical protein